MRAFDISYPQVLAFITAAWIAVRALAALRAERVLWRRELLLLTVYICLAVIARVVYFPMALENGRLGLLRFDASRMPGGVNLVPFRHMFIRYPGWKLNIIGNVAMFIPVGIFWPLCFKRLNGLFKTVLAGFGLSLIIELTQLLFYERLSDVDDLILNTAGVLIGAAIYFAARAVIKTAKRARRSEDGRNAHE